MGRERGHCGEAPRGERQFWEEDRGGRSVEEVGERGEVRVIRI